VGAVEAIVRLLRATLKHGPTVHEKWAVWQHFARWLVLGLEFELAADIIRSTIAPTWTEVGQLGAIAAIRTFLSFFLERDYESITRARGGGAEPTSGGAGEAAPLAMRLETAIDRSARP
jgi:uncharacterized membrane protein